MKKNKMAAGLLACIMACTPVLNMNPVQASAVNLHDETTMTEEEKQIKEYCDIIVNLVNNERKAAGLCELKTFSLLNEVTCTRAEELERVFDHMRPDGTTCFSAIKQAGVKYGTSAENIAAGREDPVSTMEQWMNSKGHRDNILRDGYTHIGIGYYHMPLEDYPDDYERPRYEYYWSMFLIRSVTGTEERVFEGQYIPERFYGDPDGDHNINAADAKLILHYAAAHAAGLETFDPPAGFVEASDINRDGKIDAIDAAVILEYSAAKGAGGSNVLLSDFVW